LLETQNDLPLSSSFGLRSCVGFQHMRATSAHSIVYSGSIHPTAEMDLMPERYLSYQAQACIAFRLERTRAQGELPVQHSQRTTLLLTTFLCACTNYTRGVAEILARNRSWGLSKLGVAFQRGRRYTTWWSAVVSTRPGGFSGTIW
jgi:hypothetical protein